MNNSTLSITWIVTTSSPKSSFYPNIVAILVGIVAWLPAALLLGFFIVRDVLAFRERRVWPYDTVSLHCSGGMLYIVLSAFCSILAIDLAVANALGFVALSSADSDHWFRFILAMLGNVSLVGMGVFPSTFHTRFGWIHIGFASFFLFETTVSNIWWTVHCWGYWQDFWVSVANILAMLNIPLLMIWGVFMVLAQILIHRFAHRYGLNEHSPLVATAESLEWAGTHDPESCQEASCSNRRDHPWICFCSYNSEVILFVSTVACTLLQALIANPEFPLGPTDLSGNMIC